jgi:septum formation protein
VTLVLASASPRRRELLERIGVAIEIAPAGADESVRAGEDPTSCAVRLATAKAELTAAARPGAWVLGADTVVSIAGDLLGKPADVAEAAQMIERLAGAEHQVTTGVCLISPDRGAATRPEGAASPGGSRQRSTRAITTAVIMRELDAAEIDAYVSSGEWRGKAGGYAIQGIAAALVREVRGSVTNVIGLPVAEVVEMLAAAGAPGPDYRGGRPA